MPAASWSCQLPPSCAPPLGELDAPGYGCQGLSLPPDASAAHTLALGACATRAPQPES